MKPREVVGPPKSAGFNEAPPEIVVVVPPVEVKPKMGRPILGKPTGKLTVADTTAALKEE